MRYGYIQTLTREHDTVEQLLGPVEKVVEEKMKTKTDSMRKELNDFLATANPGDELVVHSMDRLAHSLSHFLRIVERASARGVTLIFVQEKLNIEPEPDVDTALILMGIRMSSAHERQIGLVSQRLGYRRSIKIGQRLGGKPRLNHDLAISLLEKGYTSIEVAEKMGMSQRHVYYIKHHYMESMTDTEIAESRINFRRQSRTIEVCALIDAGRTANEIAAHLCMSRSTVYSIRRRYLSQTEFPEGVTGAQFSSRNDPKSGDQIDAEIGS